jgi:hypothetical protein
LHPAGLLGPLRDRPASISSISETINMSASDIETKMRLHVAAGGEGPAEAAAMRRSHPFERRAQRLADRRRVPVLVTYEGVDGRERQAAFMPRATTEVLRGRRLSMLRDVLRSNGERELRVNARRLKWSSTGSPLIVINTRTLILPRDATLLRTADDFA